MKIGFDLFGSEKNNNIESTPVKGCFPEESDAPVRSVTRIYFPERGFACSYYNDRFNLKIGDLVFVDGKLEGRFGIVEEVNKNFKIKVSDYKRVIAKADTTVRGELFFGDNMLIAFDKSVISYEKVRSWLLPPDEDDEEYIYQNDDVFFPLDVPRSFGATDENIKGGIACYENGNVACLCLDGKKIRAIVIGHNVYEVEFEYKNGEVGNFSCGCWCSGFCEHEVAAVLALKSSLEKIENEYVKEYEKSNYFAAVDRELFESRIIGRKRSGKITISD